MDSLRGRCIGGSGDGRGNWDLLRSSSGETLEPELLPEVVRCQENRWLHGGGMGGGMRKGLFVTLSSSVPGVPFSGTDVNCAAKSTTSTSVASRSACDSWATEVKLVPTAVTVNRRAS